MLIQRGELGVWNFGEMRLLDLFKWAWLGLEIILLNNNNNNNSLYFQRVTHLAKKTLIFHEALYELPPKNNTSIKYKDDLHVYKIIQTSWNTFKPTYTQAYFLHKYYIYHTPRYKWLVIPILSTHMGSQKKRLNETLLMSTKLNN